MKTIAVVGTSSNLSKPEELEAQQIIQELLQDAISKFEIKVISGGAKGIDSLAIKVAQQMKLKTKVYNPKKYAWKYFKKRNEEIAKDCDFLACISIPVKTQKCYHHQEAEDHEKTAGCWTMNKALELGKTCNFFIVRGTDI